MPRPGFFRNFSTRTPHQHPRFRLSVVSSRVRSSGVITNRYTESIVGSHSSVPASCSSTVLLDNEFIVPPNHPFVVHINNHLAATRGCGSSFPSTAAIRTSPSSWIRNLVVSFLRRRPGCCLWSVLFRSYNLLYYYSCSVHLGVVVQSWIGRALYLPVYTVKPRIPETVNFGSNGNYFTISAVLRRICTRNFSKFPGNGNLITVSGIRGCTV